MIKLGRSPARLSIVAAALAVSLAAPDAMAAPVKDINEARERFREGVADMAAKNYARALEAFKDVAEFKSSAQVRFNIATCEENLDDYLRAMGSYRLALTEATKSSAKDIEKAVTLALANLEPRIPMLLVKRGEGAGVAEVTLDGRPLANPSIGVEFAINPGPHAIAATAPDRLPFSGEVTLADRDHKTITIVLKPKPVLAPPPPDVTSTTNKPPPDGGDQPPDTPPPDSGNRKMKIAGFAVGGAGVVGLVLSGVFFGMRQKAISDLNAECGPMKNMCPASALGEKNSGSSDATASTGLFVAGLALAGAGGIMIGVASRSKKADPAPAAGLVLTPNGAALRGAF